MKSQVRALSISICLSRSGVLRRRGDKRTTYTIISPAPCTRGTGKSEGFGGDFMQIASQGAGVLWVLEVSVTYVNLITILHFLGATPLISVPSAWRQHSSGACYLLPCSAGSPGSLLQARKKVSPVILHSVTKSPVAAWSKLRIIPDSEVILLKTRISHLESYP